MIKLNKFSGMKDFLLLWSSQSISILGSSLTSYALIIWVYQQKSTATSITMLSFCALLPQILFSFVAGTIVDKWNKKIIMLLGVALSALGTLTVFILFTTGNLHILHIYIINFLLSFIGAFQNPASYVAESQLVPREHYIRASGLQAFSGSIISITSPALATALLVFGGFSIIFVIDLISFAFAFVSLLFFIKIPSLQTDDIKGKEPFVKRCFDGINFLRDNNSLLQIIIFFSFINLLAYMTGYGIMPALILARSGNNKTVLGLISSFIGIGTLVGSAIITVMKPPKSKTKVIFISLAASFLLEHELLAIGQNVWIWIFAAFAGNIVIPFIGANMTTIMRTKIPIEMQGRVFAARDTLQFFTRPLGLFLGGFLADNIFEPFMKTASPLQQFLSKLFGTGKGSGMAIMFFITGTVGCIASLIALTKSKYRKLDT